MSSCVHADGKRTAERSLPCLGKPLLSPGHVRALPGSASPLISWVGSECLSSVSSWALQLLLMVVALQTQATYAWGGETQWNSQWHGW